MDRNCQKQQCNLGMHTCFKLQSHYNLRKSQKVIKKLQYITNGIKWSANKKVPNLTKMKYGIDWRNTNTDTKVAMLEDLVHPQTL